MAEFTALDMTNEHNATVIAVVSAAYLTESCIILQMYMQAFKITGSFVGSV